MTTSDKRESVYNRSTCIPVYGARSSGHCRVTDTMKLAQPAYSNSIINRVINLINKLFISQ